MTAPRLGAGCSLAAPSLLLRRGVRAAAQQQSEPDDRPRRRRRPTVQLTTSSSPTRARPNGSRRRAPPNPCDTAAGRRGAGRDLDRPRRLLGPFPSSHYDIGCDEGAWNHISRKVYCTFTDLAFQGARSSTAMALWLVEWAYGFGVYDRLGGPAIDIAESYQHELIGPLGLGDLAWFYAVAWAAITALRGRLTMAAGELLTSIVAAGLAGVVLANPAGYLQGTFDTMGKLSGALLATGTGQPPPDERRRCRRRPAAPAGPDPRRVRRGALRLPQLGRHRCRRHAQPCATASSPPDRTATTTNPARPWHVAGCQAQADFNHDPNGTRLFGAVLTFGAAVVMVVLMALVALTIVVAQVVADRPVRHRAVRAARRRPPRRRRELAWRWLAALVRVVLAVVGMSFVLSLLLLTVTALLQADRRRRPRRALRAGEHRRRRHVRRPQAHPRRRPQPRRPASASASRPAGLAASASRPGSPRPRSPAPPASRSARASVPTAASRTSRAASRRRPQLPRQPTRHPVTTRRRRTRRTPSRNNVDTPTHGVHRRRRRQPHRPLGRHRRRPVGDDPPRPRRTLAPGAADQPPRRGSRAPAQHVMGDPAPRRSRRPMTTSGDEDAVTDVEDA